LLKPLVSVVIVTYERPALLRKCLLSVRSHVVLVDDESQSRAANDALDALEQSLRSLGGRMCARGILS
jgi:glycosyltransferase involved in cell wall biosynthesis